MTSRDGEGNEGSTPSTHESEAINGRELVTSDLPDLQQQQQRSTPSARGRRSIVDEQDPLRTGSQYLSPSHYVTNSYDQLMSSDIPQDKYNQVKIGFFILGITTLLQWSFFITATDYWMYKFRDVTKEVYTPIVRQSPDSRTPMQTFIESYLSIAANVPLVIAMVLNMLYGQRIRFQLRVYVPLVVMLVVFIIITIFVKIDTDDIQTLFLLITIVLVVLISFFSAIFHASLYGIVAKYPSGCMHALVGGQAFAGLLAVVVQVLSMVGDSGPITSGLIYFSSSVLFLVFTIAYYSFCMDNKYMKYYMLRGGDQNRSSDQDTSPNRSQNASTSSLVALDVIDTFKDGWKMVIAMTLVCWATLAVYPGISSLIVPQLKDTSIFTGKFFVPITTFFLFNCGDLAGRVSSTFLPFPDHKENLLLLLTIVRSILPFSIIFCNVQPKNHATTLFSNDIYYPILNTLTAFTHGYIFSSAMLLASNNSRPGRLELTGFIMATSVGIGLTLGSVSSNILLMFI